ncbi:MAG: acyltransferase [Sphingobium sp.]
MNPPRPHRLNGLQALRGVAAVAVLLYHAMRHLAKNDVPLPFASIFQPGHAGVDLFFVLSGFIILHVHRSDIGRPDRLARYGWQRFARLMPIYWIALGATILALLPGHPEVVTGGALLASASLLPTWEEPLLGVAWTLQHEAFFYIAFALLVASRRLGLALFALWFLWVAGQSAGLLPAIPVPRLGSMANLEFLAGMIAALAVAGGKLRTHLLIALIGGSGFILAGVMEATGRMDGHGDLARIAYGLPSALLIAGLAAWESARPRAVPGALVAVGEASYSLYLFHLLGLGIAWQIWTRLGLDAKAAPVLCFVALATAAIALGLAVHRWVEAPLMARLRRVHDHSWRKASIGLSPAARRAGK